MLVGDPAECIVHDLHQGKEGDACVSQSLRYVVPEGQVDGYGVEYCGNQTEGQQFEGIFFDQRVPGEVDCAQDKVSHRGHVEEVLGIAVLVVEGN